MLEEVFTTETREDIRLQELVAALKLLVFRPNNFYAVNNLHKTGLELLGLSRVHKLVIASKQYRYRQGCSTTGGVQGEHCNCRCLVLLLRLRLRAIAARDGNVWW